jgi:NAD(P)-dependent dehydrogenase (short-subunit alcohol dehydrogenase family)
MFAFQKICIARYTIQLGGTALAKLAGGSMVFMGSISGMRSVVNQPAYGTAKAALLQLVKVAVHELGLQGT